MIELTHLLRCRSLMSLSHFSPSPRLSTITPSHAALFQLLPRHTHIHTTHRTSTRKLTAASSHASQLSSSSSSSSSSSLCSTSSNPSLSSHRLLHSSSSLSSLPTLSASSLLVNAATSSLHNGIMSHDDFYVNGLPTSKFQSEGAGLVRELERVFEVHSAVDPFAYVGEDMRELSAHIKEVIGSDHSILNKIAAYFFEVNGKRIRPAIVLLMSKALRSGLKDSISASISSSTTFPLPSSSSSPSPSSSSSSSLLHSQLRLSEITEMIHTASLLHDDVIDEASTRRGVSSVNHKFGNKFAILGGDFLLARASVALARLRVPEVIELLSTVIEHLVKGEMMQLKSNVSSAAIAAAARTALESPSPSTTSHAHSVFTSCMQAYMTKTYYKTASLMANSCRATAVLSHSSPHEQDIAYEYGRNLGLAFQIIDDVLDVEGSGSVMGKPPLLDLQGGVVTAPILFALREVPELEELMERKFAREGDVEMGLEMIRKSGGVERARELAEQCAAQAIAAVLELKASQAQSALIQIVKQVIYRDK